MFHLLLVPSITEISSKNSILGVPLPRVSVSEVDDRHEELEGGQQQSESYGHGSLQTREKWITTELDGVIREE